MNRTVNDADRLMDLIDELERLARAEAEAHIRCERARHDVREWLAAYRLANREAKP